MAFVANFYFLYVTTDYFARAAADFPLLHTWSLAIEEQYYLIWPILMLAAAKLRTTKGDSQYRLPRADHRRHNQLVCIMRDDDASLGSRSLFSPSDASLELGAGSTLALIRFEASGACRYRGFNFCLRPYIDRRGSGAN